MRSGARYKRTLDLLSNAKKFSPGMVTKSGLMVGLGETTEELVDIFSDLGHRDYVDILSIGQYVPIARSSPIATLATEELVFLQEQALRFGFRHVESGPWCAPVHAHEQAEATAGLINYLPEA